MRPEVLALLGELLDDREILLRRLEQAAAVDLSTGDDADFALVALSLHHAYAAMEAMLTRSVRFFDGEPPAGADHHRALLHRAGLVIPSVRPAILTRASLAPARELMKFRHFLRHDYGAELDPAQLVVMQGHARVLKTSFAADLLAFETWLRAVAEQ